MRQLFVMGMLVVLATSVLAEPGEPASPLSPLEIRIPAITKKWKRPEGDNRPDITIDDIERCMGQDVSLQQEVQGLRQAQSQLESERAELSKANADLAQGAQALVTRRQAHQARVDQFHNDSASLARRLTDIEKRKAAPARTRQDVAQTNQLVAAYNEDAARLNGLRLVLMQEQDAFNRAVATHNEDVARINQLVARFNERNGAFQSRAADMASTSTAYNASCAGERVLRK